MKQKYPKLLFVHVCKEMPSDMSHFDSDFDAIVEGTYAQLHGGRDVDSYSIYKIRGGRIVNTISWYEEYQLTSLEEQDKKLAKAMIKTYRLEV